MLEKLQIFNMATAMAQHAGTRQATIAQNIAHADTPGYRAREVAPFADTYRQDSNPHFQRATRAGHITGNASGFQAEFISADRNGAESPNGNNVSLEQEMLNATETKRQHDLALTIYKSSLNILRSSIGR